MDERVCAHADEHMRAHMCAHVRACVHVYMCACVHACMFACVHVCICACMGAMSVLQLVKAQRSPEMSLLEDLCMLQVCLYYSIGIYMDMCTCLPVLGMCRTLRKLRHF